MDVHVNRMPVGGRVTSGEVSSRPVSAGVRADAGDLNEYTEVTIDHGGQTDRRPADRRHPGAPHRVPR